MIDLPTTRRALLSLALALSLAGCGGKPPPPPAVLTLTLQGSANQNPDPTGAGNTVAVQVYQLTATGKFQSTDFYSLFSHEATVLGTDEAGASEQLLLIPGKTLTITRPLKPDVVAIGVAVLFRDINHSTWRLVAPVAASGPSQVTISITGLTAAIVDAKP
jgi:type VI secretion system protein VasD